MLNSRIGKNVKWKRTKDFCKQLYGGNCVNSKTKTKNLEMEKV